jgi:serine/threonine protein kinase
MAPEVKQGRYGVKADIWSAGVVLYELMTVGGELPILSERITAENEKQVHEQLRDQMKVFHFSSFLMLLGRWFI